MLKNYLKIAFRSLVKQKVYSLINILGLTVGIASCLLIVLFVTNEFSYDNFHRNADRIFKVALERRYPNHSTFYAIIPHSYAEVMDNDFPEVEQSVKMGGPFNNILVTYETPSKEEKRFEENFVMAADSNFFKFFNIAVIKGTPEKALVNITDIVLTEKTAKRYFGSDEPLGKTIRMFNQDYNVSAVCEDIPDNSHFKFDFLFKWNDNFFGGGQSNFISFSAHTYLQLTPGSDPKVLEG
jgi:putative ABC transport system permease protein